MVKPEQKMIVSLHNAIPLFARGQKYSSTVILVSYKAFYLQHGQTSVPQQ